MDTITGIKIFAYWLGIVLLFIQWMELGADFQQVAAKFNSSSDPPDSQILDVKKQLDRLWFWRFVVLVLFISMIVFGFHRFISDE